MFKKQSQYREDLNILINIYTYIHIYKYSQGTVFDAGDTAMIKNNPHRFTVQYWKHTLIK